MIDTYETDHYVFHFLKDSLAERDILQISEVQEQCFDRICDCLNIKYSKKIGYWFYNSPQLIGNAFFDGALCNGVSITDAQDDDIGKIVSLSGEKEDSFVVEPCSIHAVYEERIKCIGPHEDTHVIAAQLFEPSSAFLCEGLAMMMDGSWWGIENKFWARYYKDTGKIYPVHDLINCTEDEFYGLESGKTYPVAGAWTEYMFQTFGKEKYMRFYWGDGTSQVAIDVFGKSLPQICREFEEWLSELPFPDDQRRKIDLKI